MIENSRNALRQPPGAMTRSGPAQRERAGGASESVTVISCRRLEREIRNSPRHQYAAGDSSFAAIPLQQIVNQSNLRLFPAGAEVLFQEFPCVRLLARGDLLRR